MFGMALVVKEYKSPDPLKVGLFCANGVVFFADYFADSVEKSHGVPPSSNVVPVVRQLLIKILIEHKNCNSKLFK